MTMNMHSPTVPSSVAGLQRLLDDELSLPARLAHVALLLAALMMTTVVATLWTTEAGLPPRTQTAFAVMTVIGVSWIIYAVWVLTHRRPLLARHRIVAGRMAVIFTATFVIGAVAVAATVGGAAPYAAGGVGLVMLGVAVTLLVHAHHRFARLSERRATLERELALGVERRSDGRI